MRRIKAVLLDLDGTTVKPDTTVSPDVIAVVNELQRRSIVVAPVTGRRHAGASAIIEQFGFKQYGVFGGGSSVIDLRPGVRCGEAVWERRIDPLTTRRIVESLLPYARRINAGNGALAAAHVSLDLIDHDTRNVWAEVEPAKVQAIIKALSRVPGIQVHQNRSPDDRFIGIQVTHRGANKGIASRAMLRKLRISPKNALAIGNDDNDIPLLKCVRRGVGVAMGDSPASLKRVAKYTVGSVYDDGFVEAIHRYVFLRLLTQGRAMLSPGLGTLFSSSLPQVG